MISTTTGQGALIFWDSSSVRREKLQESFLALGLKKFLPQGRTELGTLLDALKSWYPEKKGYLIRPLDNAGYELLRETKGKESNTRDFLSAFLLGPDRTVLMTQRDDTRLHDINTSFRELLDYYTPTDITRCLKNMIMAVPHGLGGTSLRQCGGIYWLREETMPVFRQVSEQLESISSMRIYHVNHRLGEKEKQAVLEGIVDELRGRVDSINHEVYRGNLGNSALENKLELLDCIEAKARSYEELLDTTLSQTRAIIDRAKISITSAILMMDTQSSPLLQAAN